jgi:hypothetical protein
MAELHLADKQIYLHPVTNCRNSADRYPDYLYDQRKSPVKLRVYALIRLPPEA